MYTVQDCQTVARTSRMPRLWWLTRSKRGWVSDMASVRCCYDNFLPSLLMSSWKRRGQDVAWRQGNATITVPDFMSGTVAASRAQAQVGWGLARGYFPQLLDEMRAIKPRAWLYPFKKLTRGEAFACSNRTKHYGLLCQPT